MWRINTVTLIGRVVRDIEVNSTNSGVRSLIRTSDLTAAAWGCRRKFHRLHVAGIRQLSCWQSTHRGKQIGITGRLQTRIWEKRYQT